MPTPTELARRIYRHWNAGGLSTLSDSVDPAVVLVCDPLRPDESGLRGIEGWGRWVARWEEGYEAMRITVDALVPVGSEHVLALVSMCAKRRGGEDELSWAAAHVWTVRNGRIARWEPYMDLGAARRTLDL